MSTPFEEVSLAEVSEAIKGADGAIKDVLLIIQEKLENNLANWTSQLINAGYGDVESRGSPEADRLRLDPKILANLGTMPTKIADKIVAQGVAIATAQEQNPKVKTAWSEAMTAVTDPKLRELMANAEDPTSWFGAQGLANAAKALENSENDTQVQEIVDVANEMPVVVADIAAAMEEYVSGIEAGTKAWKKAGEFSLNEVIDLIGSGKFQATDFDGLKYNGGTQEDFMAKYLPQRYEDLKLRAGTDGLNLNEDERAEYLAWQPIIQAYFEQIAKDTNKAMLDSITAVFDKPEDIAKSISNNKIFNKAIAEAIGTVLGKVAIEDETGGYSFGEETDTFAIAAEAADLFGINLYNYNKYVKDSYDGLEDLEKLEQQVAEAQNNRYINALEKEARLAQYYSAQNKIIMDPKSYDFMGSAYKDNLEPMYTLIENEQKALDVLKTSGKDGKISTKELRKLLNWTKGSDNKQLRELRSASTSLNNELDTKVNQEQIDALKLALEKADKEAVARYNEEVNQNNTFLSTLDNLGKDYELKDKKGNPIMYLGQEYKTLDDLKKILDATADEEQVQKAMAIAADLHAAGADLGESIKQGMEAVGLVEKTPLASLDSNVQAILKLMQPPGQEDGGEGSPQATQ